MTKYWLVVTDPENFATSRQINFDVEGFHDLFKNTVKNVIQTDDEFVYYIKGNKEFGAITRAKSPYFYCEKKIWKKGLPNKPNEIFPHRFKIMPVLIPRNKKMLDARYVIENLPSVKNKQSWGWYVHHSLRNISNEDFDFIEDEMKKSGLFKEVKQQE